MERQQGPNQTSPFEEINENKQLKTELANTALTELRVLASQHEIDSVEISILPQKQLVDRCHDKKIKTGGKSRLAIEKKLLEKIIYSKIKTV